MKSNGIVKVVKKVKLTEQKSDFAYWQSQPPSARLEALEEIRREYHRWKYGTDQDFKEFIESLNANGVRYLVVGGYAVAFHGHPRYTKDIDVWIEMSQDNAAKIVKALSDFGFAPLA